MAPNGAGKSSLLEAIYLAGTGRSFRAADLTDLVSRPAAAEPTTVLAEVERDGVWELGALVGAGRRERSVQGKPAPLARQLELLPLVVWSEAEHELVRGPDELRRRLFDRAALLLEPATTAAEAAHARAWRQKRRLLAQGGAGLSAWNELLAPHLARRAAVRVALAAELAGEANARLERAGAPLPPLRLDYAPSPPAAAEGTEATLAALAAAAAAERARAQPLIGPQRDRIAVALGDTGARRFASGGEQKLVALALLAALAALLARRDRPPLVLLDDVESELDAERARLAAGLFADARQVVATSSRESADTAFTRARWRLGDRAISQD